MADPVTGAIAAVLVKVGVGAKTAAVVANVAFAVAQMAALNAVGGAISQAQAQKASGMQLEFMADSQLPKTILLGRSAVAGKAAFQYPSASGRKKFDNCIVNYFPVLTGCGPIDAIEAFEMNGERVFWNNATGQVTSGKYKDKMWLKTTTGAWGGPALTPPAWPAGWHISFPEWTANHKLSGWAHAWLSIYYEEGDGTWSGGVNPLFIIRGVRGYDPRRDSTYPGGSGPQRIHLPETWEWTQNPYVCGLTWLIGWWENGKLSGGCGIPPAGINIQSFVEGANIADFNGWKCGGEVTMLTSLLGVLKSILQSGGGKPITTGAEVSCMVNAPRTALTTVTIDDLAGGFSIPATKSRRERKNSIVPRYRSEAHNWEIVSAAPVTVLEYVTADGGLRQEEVEYPLCQDAKQVGQLAAYDLVNGREFGPIPMPLKTRMIGFKPGDAFYVNIPEAGLNNQKVVIENRLPDFGTGGVVLTVESETDSKHAFALGQEPHPPVAPGLTRPDYGDTASPEADEWSAAAGA
ncbi:MAG: hypothetical protein AAGC58_11260, partial [Asticcacaulis sp.]